jgi:hypothetical protein
MCAGAQSVERGSARGFSNSAPQTGVSFVYFYGNAILAVIVLLLCGSFVSGVPAGAQTQATPVLSRWVNVQGAALAESPNYRAVQQRLARGWNTWDVNSGITQVSLPEGLAIHVGLKHNTTEAGDAFLQDALIGRLNPGAEKVTPGPHSWNGSYTDVCNAWKRHYWRLLSAHDGDDPDDFLLEFPGKPLFSTSSAASCRAPSCSFAHRSQASQEPSRYSRNLCPASICGLPLQFRPARSYAKEFLEPKSPNRKAA